MLGQTNCFHPLHRSLSFDCCFVLDYNKLSVFHLGSTFFILDFDLKLKNKLYNWNGYMYPKKVVAVTCHGKNPLVIGTLISPPHPLLLKCDDENEGEKNHKKGGLNCVFFGNFFFYVLDNCPQVQSLK